MPDNKNIGVITEQGFVAGQLGFRPVTESELNPNPPKKEKDKEKEDKKTR